jgi:hypothetical protein
LRILFILVLALTSVGGASGAMPAAEQNALVKQYCAVCHTDAAKSGGLSLEHYDAARRNPPLAAMMLSKLNNNAMGAAGKGVPDKAAQQAWLDSTREQAAGAQEWFIARDDVISAGIVRDVPPRAPGSTDFSVYRLVVACNPTSGAGEVQLSWSPQPQTGRTLAVGIDEQPSTEYTLEGKESMGNGSSLLSGLGSLVLAKSGSSLILPKRSLTIRGLFDGETVVFPFVELDQNVRSELGRCF